MRKPTFVLILGAAIAPGACSSETPPTPSTTAIPAAATAPVAGARLYVTNEISGDLSVIDVGSRKVVATIPLGKRPRGIQISPDRSTIYVALSGSPIAPPGIDESTLPPPDRAADGIGVVDAKQGTLTKILKVGADPEKLSLSNDGALMFVSNEDTAKASIVDVMAGAIVATVNVGGEPEGVDTRPDGKVVYVTSEEDGAVFVIDVERRTLLTKFDVGPRPRSTAFLPNSTRAYVTSENGSSVAVVDAMAHKVLKTITLSGEMIRPMGAVVSPDGAFLYVTTGRGKTLVAIDTKTDTPVWSVEVGQRPWGVAISPDGKTLFTANGPSNDVSIVDVASRAVTARVSVGERPWGVALLP